MPAILADSRLVVFQKWAEIKGFQPQLPFGIKFARIVL
jgi:hypothetical protein